MVFEKSIEVSKGHVSPIEMKRSSSNGTSQSHRSKYGIRRKMDEGSVGFHPFTFIDRSFSFPNTSGDFPELSAGGCSALSAPSKVCSCGMSTKNLYLQSIDRCITD
uniref:Uncharacterized protein n=1 Tax=Anopheles darlingi TaxID=43151 RepID=A0A2M4CK74_ANODA